MFLKKKKKLYATHSSLPLNSSPELPETPLSPLLTPTDPSQISSPTCTIRSNTTTKPHLPARKELSCFHAQFCLCYTDTLNYLEFICNVGPLLLATKELLKEELIFSRLRANALVHISNIHQCTVEQLASLILATKFPTHFLGNYKQQYTSICSDKTSLFLSKSSNPIVSFQCSNPHI